MPFPSSVNILLITFPLLDAFFSVKGTGVMGGWWWSCRCLRRSVSPSWIEQDQVGAITQPGWRLYPQSWLEQAAVWATVIRSSCHGNRLLMLSRFQNLSPHPSLVIFLPSLFFSPGAMGLHWAGVVGQQQASANLRQTSMGRWWPSQWEGGPVWPRILR